MPFIWKNVLQSLHYEAELSIKICKKGKNISVENAHKHYREVTLGLDLTDRAFQAVCKKKGHPWEKANAFDHSAVIGTFMPFKDAQNKKGDVAFSLKKNGKWVQKGNSKHMMTPIDKLIAYASKYFTLCAGDILLTGTPEGVGQL